MDLTTGEGEALEQKAAQADNARGLCADGSRRFDS